MRFSILFAVLLVSFLIRIPRFDYPFSYIFSWGDGTRDYLVANHILNFNEFPLVGPYNLFFDSGVKNSPLYFYLLSVFLIPVNNILVLSILNIILQVAVIALIYFIGKDFFNKRVGIIASIIYSISPELIQHADFVWQPNLMLPVALLGLYLLRWSQLKNNLTALFSSLILLSLAATLHNSALPWLPVFVLTAFLILKKMKKAPSYYFGIFTTVPVSLAVFHLPLIFFYLAGSAKVSLNSTNINILNNFLPNLYYNLNLFFKMFYLNWVLGSILIIFIIIILTFWRRNSLILAFILFILPIVLASFLSKVRLHYLTLSVPMFVIVVVAALTTINIRFLKIGLMVFMITLFSGNFYFLKEFKKPLENYHLVMEVTDKIVRDLQNIKREDNFTNYDFFQVNSIAELQDGSGVFHYPVLDTIFIVPLEKKLNIKLVRVSDMSPYNHYQIGRKDYVVVSCIKVTKELCKRKFEEENSGYNFVKVSYEGPEFFVFLAKAK